MRATKKKHLDPSCNRTANVIFTKLSQLVLMAIFTMLFFMHHNRYNVALVADSASLLSLLSSSEKSTDTNRLLSQFGKELMPKIPSYTTITSTTRDRKMQGNDGYGEGGDDVAMTNPYISGCLYSMGLEAQKRVCNSEDTIETIASGKCRSAQDFDYMEIRIQSGHWDSITFEAWLLQIILSEILDVPTTIESGNYDGSLNFYNHQSDIIYATPGSDTALQRAYEMKDCRLADHQKSLEQYEPCAHVYPERWTSIQYDSTLSDLVHEGVVEPPYTLGVLGLDTIFITKFTVVNDPTLTSYLGLSGEEYRTKLAETFLRPTTWFEYCTQVSDNNCSIPNDVAQRFPSTLVEQEQYFSKDNYIGHFRMTEENDCKLNPTNCTGHIAGYACAWNSYLIPQLHYLNIALQSSGPDGPVHGYADFHLRDIWRAANATKSNLIMQYWSPEPLHQDFLETDAEMFRIAMPSRTQECLDKRRPLEDICSESFELRIGEPEGICEESSKPLWKVLVGNLYDIIYDPAISDAIRSPAYDVLQLFQISELQLGQIFDYHRIENTTPRDAVCRWALNHSDYLQSFVPRAYPRTIRSGATENGVNRNGAPLIYVSTIMGGITSLIVLVTWYMVHQHRNTIQAIRTAQIEFLHLLLAGSLGIGIGSILVGLPPTNSSCRASIWFINLGYTLELVPLIVKIAAINKLIGAARQFRRVVLKRKSLFGAVCGISGMVFIFLLTWTVLDPPSKHQDFTMSSDVVQDSLGNNRFVVDVLYFCSSESMVWDYIAIGWNLLLLLCATVLAVQTRTVQKDFNESQTLAFLIYSHFLFVLLRLILLIITGSLNTASSISESTLSGMRSLIFSVDTMATIIIYFLPKFLSGSTDRSPSTFSFNGLTSSGSARSGSSEIMANIIRNSFPLLRRSTLIVNQINENEGDKAVTEKDATEISTDVTSNTCITGFTHSRDKDDRSNEPRDGHDDNAQSAIENKGESSNMSTLLSI